ncbi:MAG TPA: hypothetical protein VFD06_06585, partial [Candidatus Polarisedimenticolia bacterium]|nr:hypothetical protein [Candidatus Polarisedimenticolia bacterium]
GLRFTATGDNGNVGTATTFDVRYRIGAPINNEADFAAAIAAAGEPAPGPAGTVTFYAIVPLAASTPYFIRMKVLDEVPNASTLSNQVTATTTAVDGAAPASVTLAGTPNGLGLVGLTWTAPGDDGPFGIAAGYDLRRSLTPITTLAAFNAATPVAGEPPPAPAGTPQGMTVGGLAPGTDWSFAVRAFDEAGNGSTVPAMAMTVATLPQFLEFGPVTNLNRIETIATSYSAVTSLGGGSWRLSGNADVTLGGALRSFAFANLDVATTGELANDGVSRAARVTAGSVTVNIAGNPIDYPLAGDLDLQLLSFRLSSIGGEIVPGGLRLTLPPGLTSSIGDVLTFFVTTGLAQDLDFNAIVTPGPGFFFAPKDYPFRIAPEVGILYIATRSRVELGPSLYSPIDKERGILSPAGCAVAGACIEQANDLYFSFPWTFNAYAGGGGPPGTIGTPYFEPDGLRATLVLTADGTHRPLFPAGVEIPILAGSRIEFIAGEPAGGILAGEVELTMSRGARVPDGEGGIRADCSSSSDLVRSAGFAAGEIQVGGRMTIDAMTLIPGKVFSEIPWGQPGVNPGDPQTSGFFVGGLDSSNLSFYAPGTVARLTTARPSVQAHLLAERDDLSGAGTYAGMNIAMDAGAPGTFGLDSLCPEAPDVPGGHSLEVSSDSTRLYARASGVSGIGDGGSLDPPRDFDYMGYDMTLSHFAVAFLDNAVPTREGSGVVISHVQIPNPSGIGFDFESPAGIDSCGGFTDSLGDMTNAGTPQTLVCWEADFTPFAARFQKVDAELEPECAGVAPPPRCCIGETPPLCPDLDASEVRYLHFSARVPFELEPGTPAVAHFDEQVPMDFAPGPLGNLVCNDIQPTTPGGTVRNEFEPEYGFDVDVTRAALRPENPACPAPLKGGPAPAVPDPDPARYEVEGETLFPFYGGTAGCAVVKQLGLVEVGGSCLPNAPPPMHVHRRVFADLFALDFDLHYLPPIRLPDARATAARFFAQDATLDAGLFTVPVAVKLLGEVSDGAPGVPQTEEAPQLFFGFLSDLSAYVEAIQDNDVCDAACLDRLEDLVDLDVGNPEIDVDRLLPGMRAYYDRAKALGVPDLRRVAADALHQTVGSVLPADFVSGARRARGVVSNLMAVTDAFKTKDLTGAGVFETYAGEAADYVLDTAQLDTEVDALAFLNFKGFVHFNRHTANAVGDTDDTAHLTIGAHDVDLSWAIDSVRARTIEGTFLFDPGPTFTGFEGMIELTGMRFGEVAVDQAGLLLGLGNPAGPDNDFHYVAASARGGYKNVTAEVGLFLGKSIDLDPLIYVDPD